MQTVMSFAERGIGIKFTISYGKHSVLAWMEKCVDT